METEIAATEAPSNTDGSFEIYLAWQDVTLTVRGEQAAIDVLVQAGVPIEPGCSVGGCGQCVTRYVEGDVIHKDACLNDEERKTMFCPCVSRARSRIVLAL
ncbi:MAG TPA: 2Fe-2S iron-sulfur cluster binding domain-containing protein [Hyphomicrobiaceae bacterium]|nr:2Fe-2S iron-sulfur cluster binding domain-containing protein [Hyphomicrobiaceae bacterium]